MEMDGAKVVELGDRAIHTILTVKDYVKIFFYEGSFTTINKAVALAFAPEHITATGTIFVAYIYIYEGNDRHVTGVFTNLTKAVQAMLAAKQRLELTKNIDVFIDPR